MVRLLIRLEGEHIRMIFPRLGYFVIIVCFLLLYPFGKIQAYDGKRAGFFFGIGIEPGISAYRPAYYNGDSYFYGKPSFTLNYKVGYAPSETLLIYFTTRPSIDGGYTYNYFQEGNFNRKSGDTFDGTSGLGFMLFPNRDSDFYISGCFGLGTRIDFSFLSLDSTGFGISGGIGREIFPNLTVDLTLDYRRLKYIGGYHYEDDHELDFSGFSPIDEFEEPPDNLVTLSLAFNFLLY